MVKVRQDAWSHEDDLLLAETVLRHIREGSTQLTAFEEVGDKLNRTSAACGFRWNAEVRKRYDQAIDIAKRQRKEKKRALAKQHSEHREESPRVAMHFDPKEELDSTSMNHEMNYSSTSMNTNNNHNDFNYETTNTSTRNNNNNYMNQSSGELNLDTVIRYLRNLKSDVKENHQNKGQVNKLIHENESLKQEKNDLINRLRKMEEKFQTAQEDYQVLIQIMDRARKMVVFDEQDDNAAKAAFRMEKNGNLEQVAR